MFNLQDPTHNSDFGTSSAVALFNLLKKPVWNQYLELLRISVPPEILVPWKFLLNLRGTTDVELNIFPYPIHKKDFDIYEPVTICNFPKKSSKKQVYMCMILEY